MPKFEGVDPKTGARRYSFQKPIGLPLDFKCPCGCCHVPDWGACPQFEQGANGLCVYCDHSKPCHERDKDRKTYNGPLEVGIRG